MGSASSGPLIYLKGHEHFMRGRKEKQGRRWVDLDLSVSGKLLSWTARLSSSLSAGSWLLVLQPQLLSCQVSHCQCLRPWQTAQVSHSGFSAPSGNSTRVPSGSQSERQHSPTAPLKPSMSCSLGSPLWSSISVSIGPELRNSANGHIIPLSLWMLIITLQLLQCCFCHYNNYVCCLFPSEIKRLALMFSEWYWWHRDV